MVFNKQDFFVSFTFFFLFCGVHRHTGVRAYIVPVNCFARQHARCLSVRSIQPIQSFIPLFTKCCEHMQLGTARFYDSLQRTFTTAVIFHHLVHDYDGSPIARVFVCRLQSRKTWNKARCFLSVVTSTNQVSIFTPSASILRKLKVKQCSLPDVVNAILPVTSTLLGARF